jgi:hypothetical protein
MPATRLPAFQFYPGDWLKDPALRSLPPEARGIWIDMLCIMSESPRRGVLCHVSGTPINEDELSRMIGVDKVNLLSNLRAMERVSLFSREGSGAIFCRRMLRDEDVRQRRAAGGFLGGNPQLVRTKDNQKVGKKDNLPPNLNPTPSSSSPSSSSSSFSSFSSDKDQEEGLNEEAKEESDEDEGLRAGMALGLGFSLLHPKEPSGEN